MSMMQPMPSLMTGGMIFFMVVFMALLMFAVHVIRSNHKRQRGMSLHALPDIVSIVTWIIKILLHLGIRITILGPMMLLTVRGRKTGKARTIPIDLHERTGRRFLIATHGVGNWVHNLRATGEGTLSLGHHRETFTAVELAPEEAGAIIKEVLGALLATQGIRGSTLRQQFELPANAPLQDFIKAAQNHPVFEVCSAHKTSYETTEVNKQ